MFISLLKSVFGKQFSLLNMNNILILLLCIFLNTVGALVLYSVGNGMYPWAISHINKLVFAVCIMLFIAQLHFRMIYIMIDIVYFTLLLTLCLMHFDILDSTRGRWLQIFGYSVQISELIKISTIVMVAKVLDSLSYMRFVSFVVAFAVMLVPCFFIVKQPDLGTAITLVIPCLAIIFVAGIQYRYIFLGVTLFIIAVPFIWNNLNEYQKMRFIGFFSPSAELSGVNYQIYQSKITIGSGGLFGKGFMQGTQNTLGFLPVSESDFIFPIICEEFGVVVGIFIILLYFALCMLVICSPSAGTCSFARYTSLGFAFNIFVYFFINISMVTGLIPVVGLPLVFISHGGSSVFAVTASLGLIFAMNIQKDNLKTYFWMSRN